jgi:hypothetical protein
MSIKNDEGKVGKVELYMKTVNLFLNNIKPLN